MTETFPGQYHMPYDASDPFGFDRDPRLTAASPESAADRAGRFRSALSRVAGRASGIAVKAAGGAVDAVDFSASHISSEVVGHALERTQQLADAARFVPGLRNTANTLGRVTSVASEIREASMDIAERGARTVGSEIARAATLGAMQGVGEEIGFGRGRLRPIRAVRTVASVVANPKGGVEKIIRAAAGGAAEGVRGYRTNGRSDSNMADRPAANGNVSAYNPEDPFGLDSERPAYDSDPFGLDADTSYR